MDDTPRAFLEEIRTSILKKRVGQIALAVVLAQAVWRLINALTWYLFLPLIGRILEGNTESVLLPKSIARPLPWENLFGSVAEFLFTVIVVFYTNRWIKDKPKQVTEGQTEPEFNQVGESVAPEVTEDPETTARTIRS